MRFTGVFLLKEHRPICVWEGMIIKSLQIVFITWAFKHLFSLLWGKLHCGTMRKLENDPTEKSFRTMSLKTFSLMIVGEYIVSRPLPSSKNPHFQNKRGQVHNLSCENKIFLHEWQIIPISKAEHLLSFWYRENGNSKMAYECHRVRGDEARWTVEERKEWMWK